MSKSSVTLFAIETHVKNAAKREGPDALEQAWQAAQGEGAQSDFCGFLLLAARLQESRPGESIFLPLERTALLMGEHASRRSSDGGNAPSQRGFSHCTNATFLSAVPRNISFIGLSTKKRTLCHQGRCATKLTCHHLSGQHFNR